MSWKCSGSKNKPVEALQLVSFHNKSLSGSRARRSNKVKFSFLIPETCFIFGEEESDRKWLNAGSRVLLPLCLLFWSTNQAQEQWWLSCCSHFNGGVHVSAVDCSSSSIVSHEANGSNVHHEPKQQLWGLCFYLTADMRAAPEYLL